MQSLNQDQVFVGVDVAKDTLSSCVHGAGGQRQTFDNRRGAIATWLKGLPRDAVVAMESTGRYHQLLAEMARASGREVFILNAKDVYFYAKALGARAKTDRKDAQVIARYVAEHREHLKPWVPPTADQARLQELLRCRAGVSSKRMSLLQLLHGVKGLNVSRLQKQFDALLEQVDAQIAALVARDPLLQRKCSTLRTITGIGPVGSAMLGALLSRIPFTNADALVAYSGLDPRANDSGKKNGARKISKRGAPELRRQMYLAAFSAGRSKALGPLYRSIKAKGFKPTEALVILGRKLLRVVWAVWKADRAFDPTLLWRPQTA